MKTSPAVPGGVQGARATFNHGAVVPHNWIGRACWPLMSPMPPNNFKEQEQGTMDSSIDRLIL